MMIKTNLKINNMSDYAKDKRYIVCTLVNGELWFYGATNNPEQAIDMEREDSSRITIERAQA